METKTSNINGVVSFSGHRTNRIIKFSINRQQILANVAFNTWSMIDNLCEQGYHTFLSGVAEGFDLIAAEEVLRLKKEYPHIRLVAVIPFRGQENRYTEEDKQRYNNILAQADETIYISERYFDGCFLRRNDYLLEHSARLLAYYDCIPSGGTAYTVRRAITERKMNVINVCYDH